LHHQRIDTLRKVNDTYSSYILDTGVDTAWERLFNRYLFESRFRDYKTIVDLGPGRCAFTRSAPERIIAIDNAPAVVAHYTSEGLDIRLGSADELPPGRIGGCPLLVLVAGASDRSGRHVDRDSTCAAIERLCTVRRPVGPVTHTRLLPRPYACTTFHSDITRAGGACGRIQAIRTEHLFWTRGLRRLIPGLGEQRVTRLLQLSDTMGRRLRCVNRDNLLFEVWT
jgi:hypothetical protein